MQKKNGLFPAFMGQGAPRHSQKPFYTKKRYTSFVARVLWAGCNRPPESRNLSSIYVGLHIYRGVYHTRALR